MANSGIFREPLENAEVVIFEMAYAVAKKYRLEAEWLAVFLNAICHNETVAEAIESANTEWDL